MKRALVLISFSLLAFAASAQRNTPPFAVVAYYAGRPTQIDSFHIEGLTHIIFSFCHLDGNQLSVNRAADTLVIQKMVALKARNPQMKVLLSLGGWGGCGPCSEVFSHRRSRKEFARSTKELSDYFHTDGIDLDWEYPAIAGFPSHKFDPSDKAHFTALVKRLRKTLGRQRVISFAAGGFSKYLRQSIDWKKVMKQVDMVNLMTYDLVGGYSTMTGHHTPLYSSGQQLESTQNAIRLLDSLGVPRNKLVIGAAFYGRMWENVEPVNNGLFQPGQFKMGVPYRYIDSVFSKDSGYVYYRDSVAAAPFIYHPGRRQFFTYDDIESVSAKTKYAIDNRLGGIMFWQLGEDAYENGLLEAIYDTKKRSGL